MKDALDEALGRSPVIAAVFDPSGLEAAVASPCEVVFLLGGEIGTLAQNIAFVRERSKRLYIHIELLGGVGRDAHAVRYLKQAFSPDGVITTRTNMAKYAKESGLYVIQRFFMLDSKSFDTACKMVAAPEMDAVEILPGILPEVVGQLAAAAKVPLVAGGLVRTKTQAQEALRAGASGVSTSCPELWYL